IYGLPKVRTKFKVAGAKKKAAKEAAPGAAGGTVAAPAAGAGAGAGAKGAAPAAKGAAAPAAKKGDKKERPDAGRAECGAGHGGLRLDPGRRCVRGGTAGVLVPARLPDPLSLV